MSTRQIVYAALLAALYAVIGRFLTQYLPNPMVRGGSIIAINMVVVVIAGILLGPRMGALVGFVGTLLNAIISPAGSQSFEFVAVIPHTIMGYVAGLLGRVNQIVAAFAILVGHGLNIVGFLLVGLLPFSAVAVAVFWVGLVTETVIDLIVIWITVAALRPLVRQLPA